MYQKPHINQLFWCWTIKKKKFWTLKLAVLIMRQWHFQVRAFLSLKKVAKEDWSFKGLSAWHFWLAVYWKVFVCQHQRRSKAGMSRSFLCNWLHCFYFVAYPKPSDKNELSFCPWIKESTTALERPILSKGAPENLKICGWVCKFLFLSWPPPLLE